VGLGVAARAAVAAWVALRQPDARLVVASTPPGATVTLNGRAQAGVTPLTLDHLAPGRAEVTLELRDFVQERRTVDLVEDAQPTVVAVSFRALHRRVTFQSQPPGALFSLDGVPVGQAPVKAQLTSGTRANIRVTLAGYPAFEQTLDADDIADPFVVTLAEPRKDPVVVATPREPRQEKAPAPARGSGTLTLVSKPWARVFIDGKDTGRFTPLSQWALPSGSHQVMLRNDPQDLTMKFKVTVAAGQDVKVSKELR
jgi:hypothetical protein